MEEDAAPAPAPLVLPEETLSQKLARLRAARAEAKAKHCAVVSVSFQAGRTDVLRGPRQRADEDGKKQSKQLKRAAIL